MSGSWHESTDDDAAAAADDDDELFTQVGMRRICAASWYMHPSSCVYFFIVSKSLLKTAFFP